MKKNKGFTLIELLMSMTVLIILSTLSLGVFTVFLELSQTARAKKEVLALAHQLENHRANNFSYAGFNVDSTVSPGNADGITRPIIYDITIVDVSGSHPAISAASASGTGWAIRAIPRIDERPAYLINSLGTRCENHTPSQVTYLGCGAGSQSWE